MLYIPKINFEIKANNCYPETLSKDYKVKINGNECNVNVCRVSAMPFNTWWPGHQRDVSQSELASYLNFYGDEEVELEIKCNRKFENCVVRPLSKGVAATRNGDTIKLTLKENGNYVLELDGTHFALHIFYNAPLKEVDPKDVTYYFGPGTHRPLLLNLKSGDSVYVHPEAVVYAAVYCENAQNVRIFGGGVLNNSCQERVCICCYDRNPLGNVRMFDTKGIVLEDVILMDSANWVVALFNCEDVYINNIKIVGQWRYNTDGIDLINSSNVKIKNCFVRSFDDSICIKAIHNYTCCENYEIENCVCWCDWGKTLEIGLETAAEEYRNISYKNCDLIHNSTAAMAVSNGCYAHVHNVSYENINVEFQKDTRLCVLQENDQMTYPENLFYPMGETVKITNEKFWAGYDEKIADKRDLKPAKTEDITYKNITVYKEDGIGNIKMWIHSYSDEALVDNVKLENFMVNGEPIKSLDEIELTTQNATNVTYKTTI